MVKELLTYINHHLDAEISLDSLSALTGYSPFYIHRKFKEQTGETLGSFLQHQRISTAAYLLTLTTLPVSEIKFLVGYQTDSSFSKAFRNVMKVSPRLYRANNNYSKSLSKIRKADYLSLNHEIHVFPERKAIVFPSIGNYFTKEIYNVWKEVDRYLSVNQLAVDNFEYYGILHSCQNLTPNLPGRFDAVIVPKPGVELATNKFFQSSVPGGRFVKYKFCCPVKQFRNLSIAIGKHMEDKGLQHGSGISYFKYDSLPNYQNPDYQFIEWYMPLENQ